MSGLQFIIRAKLNSLGFNTLNLRAIYIDKPKKGLQKQSTSISTRLSMEPGSARVHRAPHLPRYRALEDYSLRARSLASAFCPANAYSSGVIDKSLFLNPVTAYKTFPFRNGFSSH